MTEVLVTGCNGGIGYGITTRLLDMGYTVIGLDKTRGAVPDKITRANILKTKHPRRSNFKFYDINLADWDSLAKMIAAHRIQACLHFAALGAVAHNPANVRAYAEGNVAGFLNLIELLRDHGTKRFVYASSGMASTRGHIYGASKRFNEDIGLVYSEAHGMETAALRLGAVYGPWMRHGTWSYSVMEKVMRGGAIDINPVMSGWQPMLYTDDMTEVGVRFVTTNWNPSFKPMYIVMNKSPLITGVHFMREVLTVMGRDPDKVNYTGRTDLLAAPGEGDYNSVHAEGFADLQNAIGFVPNTPLREGIKKLCDWWTSKD